MKKKYLFVAAAVAMAALIGGLVLMYNLPLDLHKRKPLQPLPFSHKKHAGEDGVHCLFCHRSASKSPRAGIPAVSFCMKTCHPSFNFKVSELEAYGRKNEPIPWVRVYSLPDHVYFPHMMHVRAGLDCAACHGDVASMDIITRIADLKMGWCLDCHKEKGASIDCWTCHI